MSKQLNFFKKVVQDGLENNDFLALWELLESWTSQNDWMAIFFIILLGIIFEITLLKICTYLQKNPALPEKSGSNAKEACIPVEETYIKDDCLIVRIGEFSEGIVTSSLTSDENEGHFEDRASSANEIIWAGTSESNYQVSYFIESQMSSSDGTRSSLSLFHSEVKKIFLSHRGYPENEHETTQFSSKKLFSVMKNKNKNVMFSSEFNSSRTSGVTTESEDLDVTPCPPAHLFLSRDQVRLLEENVRSQILLKSKATLESKTTCLYSSPQEFLIKDQHSIKMGISAQAQDSFPRQNAIRKQGFYKAQFTSQAQQFVNNQDSINSQPDIKARHFALPQELMKTPFSSNTQDAFQTQETDRSRHLAKVPHSVQTQDSVKGLESNKKHFDEVQYSVWFEDSNRIKYAIQRQNTIFKNARCLVLTLNPHSMAKLMPQRKRAKPKGQKQIAWKCKQYTVGGSVPLLPTIKRQKKRRKALHSERKSSPKITSQKSEKTPTSQVFQIKECYTSRHSKSKCKYNTKKRELHQRRGISDIASHLTDASKHVPPYIKKYSRKKRVTIMTGLTGCRPFLLMQSKPPDAEKVNHTGSTKKRRPSGSTKNVKLCERDNEGLKNVSRTTLPQPGQCFTINTCQLKTPCSSLIETNWKNQESLKDSIAQAKETGIAEFHGPNSKKKLDLYVLKHETPLEEAISEPLQQSVSSPQMESKGRMRTWEALKCTEHSHLPLSNGENLPTTAPEMQRCFPKACRQKQKDFPEVVLKSSEVNLHISQGTQKHESTEQLAGVENQERTEDVLLKGKKPFTLTITEYGNLSESEGLGCNTGSNTKNVQGKRTPEAFHDAAATTLPAPPDAEVRSRLKVRADTSRTGLHHPLGKQEKSPEEKKIRNAEYLEKRCVLKEPQDRDREEEEETLQEAFPQLTQDFRFSLQLKQKFKYVQFEIEKSSLGSRKTQNEEQEAQSHILSTETNLGTSPCPTMGPFQDEKMKQSTDGPTGRETEDPQNPLRVSRNLPGSVVTQGSFTVHILPLSYFKRQEVRNQLPRTKRALSSRCVNMKVKKPVTLLMPYIYGRGNPSHRKILRGCFKIIIKQMTQGNTVAHVLLNACYPHVTVLPRIRMPSILNAENHRHIKPKQEKSQVAREEKCLDSITNGSNYGNTLEAQLQDEVGGDKAAQAQEVLPESWDLRRGAHPEKGLKTEEMHQPVIPAEIIMEPIHSPVMDSSHAENMKEKLPPRTVLKCTADSESPPPTPEKPLTGDPSSQTRESDAHTYGSDARERGHCLVETKGDLPATFPETFNCHTPIVTPPKERKNRVRFSQGDCTVQPRSVHMKAIKPSTSQKFKIAGHRNKLDSNFKTKLEKISQASGLVHEFLNALYSTTHSGSQGETNGFCQAQAEQGDRAGEGRRPCVHFFDRRGAFCDKGQDAEAVEHKTLLEAAPQCTQYLWPDACQTKETQLGTPDPALDRGVPSDADPQKEQAGGAEQKEPGAFGVCVPALRTSKKKRHVKQYSDMKTLVSPKYRILKAKKPSISFMLNIKGGANPNRRKELGCNSTAKMREVGQGEKVADKMYSFKTITPDINMYSKTEREKDTLGEKTPRSKPVKQLILSHEGSISSGHTKESSLQGKEEEESERETVKVILPHSQHFLLCSGQREELDLHKSESPGSGEILSLREQDFPQLMQPADPEQVERLKKSHQTQKGTTYTAGSKLPLLKSKESLTRQVLTDTVKRVPRDGSQMWELDSHSEEGRAGFKKDLQATVLGSLDVSTPGLPESKRQRKTFTCRALKSKMSGKCVVMKARKAPTSQTFNTPGNGCLKNLSPMTLKSQIIDFLVYIICSGKLGDLTIKKKEELAQELPAMNLDLSTPALPVTKRNKLELRDKKNKMSAKCVTLKAKKALVSQIFNITKCTCLSRKLKCNLKTMIKPGPPGADIILNALFSPTPVSFAMNMYNGKKVETDMPWKTRFSHKQRKQSLAGENTQWADCRDGRARALGDAKDVKDEGGEAASLHSQHLSFNAHDVTEAPFVKSGLELKNPTRKRGPESVTTAQELPQQAPPMQCGSHQSYTEFVGKESMCPKHVTLKEKKLLISQLLNGKRSLTGSPDKKCKQCKFKQRTKERQWEESVAKAFICAAKGVGIPPPKLMSEKHPFSTVARGVLYNRTHHKDLNGLITEEKAGLEEILAATSMGSLDFFMPVVSDSESQINTVHLSEKKIILNPKHLTLKKKEPPVSQIPKLNRQLTIRQRGELGSHFKTKMKGLQQGKHVADTFPKTISSPWDAADTESRFKTETDRVSRSRHVQPPQTGLPAGGPVSVQSLSAPGHAAFSINEEQEEKRDGEREETVLNADLQSVHTSMLVPPHTGMDRSPGTWGNHKDSSEKRNILNKVKVMEKQKYEQYVLFRTAPRYTQASEFGACRMRESGPAESQAPLINTVCPMDTTPQKTDIDLIDQETNIKVVEHLSLECVSFSKTHLLEIEKQQEEFKTANWEIIANPKIHTAKAEKSLTDVSPINTIECEDSLQQRERMELTGLEHLALHDKQPEPCVSGTLWSAPYAHTPVYPKTIKHKAKAETADVKNTMHTEQVKLKAQELPASHLFKTIGYGTRSNTKKLRSNVKSRKEEFKEGKTAADLALNTICESRYSQSPVKEFIEIKREKDKPRERICIPAQVKLEKALNRRNRPPLQFNDKSATSRNPKKLKQCVREQKEKRQIVLQDIVLQWRDQVVISQPVKEEDNHIKLVVNLEREAYPDLFPWKRKASYSRLDNPRIRILTDCKFLIAQRVQEGDADIVPQGREVSEKTDISLHAKEQNMFLAELDASQQKTCEEQELPKRGSISMTNQGSMSCPKTTPPPLGNIVQVTEEDTYVNRENIPQLLRRKKLKPDILQGSKGQKYLYTNLEIQQNISAVRKGEMRPNHIPERILDSTSCPRRGPLHAQEAVNTRKKENISIPVSVNVNHWGKEESKLTDNQLKANGQKVNLSKKLRAKQVHSSNQNEESILGVISSCIVHHLNIEQLKKKGSIQGMSSKFLSQMVEKASNKADFPGDPPPCSMRVNLHTSGRKKYQKESTGKGLPTSVSRSPMAVLKITLPCVGKSRKAAERPKYHTSNMEGSGLPIEEKTERLECIPQILPNPNSNPLRDRFQSKMPSRKKSSEEAVSTVDCTPHAEGIGSLLTGKEEQQEKCAYEALPKPASHSRTGLHEMNTPGQQVKLDTNVMHCEYSTPQAAEPLKGMDVISEYTQKSKTRQNLLSMEQNKQHLLIPHKNFLEHIFYPPSDPQLLQHVTPQTKKALPEVGNISNRTKGLDLFPKDQPNTVSEDGPEWTVPSVPLRHKKNQNTMLPLGSCSKTIKHLTASFPEGSTSSNEAQVIHLLSNSSSHKLRVRRKVGGTAYQRVQGTCLPGIFLHSVSTCMPILPGTKRQEDSIKQGVTKGIMYPLRTLKLKESVFSNALNSTDHVIPSSRPALQWGINEKTVNVRHRKGQPDMVVTNPCEFIPPLPHLKLSKETTDGIISNNIKTIKQCMSQRKEDRIKEGSRREIMDPNVILKAEKPSVSHILNRTELPMLLNTLKQECKAQTGKGESGVKTTNLCTFLSPLSHPNLDLRIKVGKGKSGIPRSCLLPPKLQASANVRKTSFAESMNRDNLSNVIGSKQYLPQKKREVRGHTVYVKDKMDLQHINPKGKKTSIKPTLLGKESQWNTKEQEKRMQKEKSDVGRVQRKSHASTPPSPHVEGGPGVEEEIHIQGIMGFCLPSLTLRELADEMGTGKEPIDDILSSIRKAKHLPQQDGDRVPMALEEIRHPKRRAASKAGRPVTAQGSQLNVRDRNNQAQEDERVVIQSKSCASISFPPYSEVQTRRKGEAMLIKTRSSFLQLELHESSDTGKRAYKKLIYYDMSNSVKKAKEHIVQEKEERVKMAKVTPLKKKESPILWEIQLDSKEQEKKIQKFKGEPSVVLTNTSTSMPPPSHLKWETRIKRTDHVTKITRDSLPELSPQRSDSVKKTNNKCTEGGGTGDAQEAGEDMPQGEEGNGKTAAGRAALHPRDKDVKGKNVLPQATPLNLKEGGTAGPEGDRQGEMDPKGKGQGTENGEGRGEQEAVLPTERPSEFSLAHHESEAEGKEDTQRGTGPATSQPRLQTSVDAGQLAEPQAVRDDMKAVQEYEPQEGEERGNTAHMKCVPHPRGTASKAETSPPPPVSSVAKPRALSKKKEAQWSFKEKVEQKRGRIGEPDVALTKTPSAPSPSHHRVDTGTQGDTDLLAVTGSSPSQSQPPKSAGAGKLGYAESNGNTSPCNRILKANPCAISEDNRWRLHTRHQKMSLEGINTIKLNLKPKSPEDSSPTRCMETLTVNVLSGRKKPITKLEGMNELECGTSPAEPSDGLVLTPNLQQNPQQLHDPSLSAICHCGSIGVLQNLTPEHLPACILSRDRRPSCYVPRSGVEQAHLLAEVIENPERGTEHHHPHSLSFAHRAAGPLCQLLQGAPDKLSPPRSCCENNTDFAQEQFFKNNGTVRAGMGGAKEQESSERPKLNSRPSRDGPAYAQ
ncbi:LOW QUALITY PROTEIN: leucine-rich repeat transmembrane protein CCDC168 [Manis pentadactyla]|uniref:LOW QUALITY PROTEIN: leucine-rich repeat transmembrane protein CCDC168 n=1 Tax=Manis pentadactyla TaxID=143292 RepID=UPI00255C39D4|nr:LOW QUALITY PROTEIN: leucine-rich repeat transmembrane protein CCDC168 [Manis pentadactyla]